MRVAVVTETFPPEINGVALTVAGYCKGLSARGVEVHVIRPRQSADCDEPADPCLHLVPGIRIPMYDSLQFGIARASALRRTLDAVSPDALYIATEGPLGIAALRAARQSRLPVATGFHTNFEQYARHFHLGILSRVVKAGLRRFHNSATSTLVGTEALRAELTRAGYRNARFITRGVDTDLFDPGRRDAGLRASWGAIGDTPVVIHVGRLSTEKNLPLVVRAFERFKAVRADARLVIVGDGPSRERFQRDLPDAVFCGMQTGERLATHYASGDVLLFPSLSETFGNITLEGMASGLATVAYDYAAARQHVRHKVDGMVAPFGDEAAYLACVEALARDPRLMARIRMAARATAEEVGSRRAYLDLERLLREHAGKVTDVVA